MYQQKIKVFVKDVKDEHGEKEYRYILFDMDSDSPYIYSSKKNIPARLYLDPNDGVLTSDNITRYATKNSYNLLCNLFYEDTYHAYYVSDLSYADIEPFKTYIKDIVIKLLSLSHDDKKVCNMCKKLSVLYGNI